MTDITTLMQFLFEGNYLGFLQALYVMAFQSADLLYGTITMIGMTALYIRTHSILFLSLIWILLGGLFLVAMPILANLAVFFMILGLAGMLYKTFM